MEREILRFRDIYNLNYSNNSEYYLLNVIDIVFLCATNVVIQSEVQNWKHLSRTCKSNNVQN